MSGQVFPAVVAILFGAVVGLILFVPVVAVSYRRRGRLSLGRVAFWAASLVYFLAIWSYTLLPLPASDDYRCSGAVLSLAPTIDDLVGAFADGSPLTDIRLLQVAFNVLLFLPLGFLIRVVGRRGVVIATLVGFLLSLLIETTQLTGVWGLFPCGYRLFDVGDLLTNTLGALVGSIVALLVPARLRGVEKAADAGEPRPVTRGRRLLGAVCDLLGTAILGGAAGTTVQLFLQYALRREDLVADGVIADIASGWVTIAVWTVVVLATGRTVGDLCVELRYEGGRLPEPVARALRFLGGIGGYLLLSELGAAVGILSVVFVLVWAVLFFATPAGRGLPGVVSGRRLVDARTTAPTDH
ncbi:glycopeptide antibiotics resistance protein [Microbacterium sp. SORGH_AS 505]|uniref:VanZ family protein n=1 Tax=Microbacterium sp. SORGH_AS_0505 TaxID=3041770 RepID=UPI002785FA48|nr:VanZ family protein [Microbacterium sp. SORGH_AS_0505]MDQ1126102.1 glycopeptide antibiotics resistance protein [Microbacterium sp. SORGH_AS_0505]